MVTAEPTKKYGMSCLSRVKALLEGIYQREEAVENLSRASQDIRNVGNSTLVDRIRVELRSVCKPEIGLGEFDPKADITEFDIGIFATDKSLRGHRETTTNSLRTTVNPPRTRFDTTAKPPRTSFEPLRTTVNPLRTTSNPPRNSLETPAKPP